MNDYERQRMERIAANNAKMASLGLTEAASQLRQTTTAAAAATAGARPPKAKPTPRKRKMYEIEVEVRRSGRLQGDQPEYNEENMAAIQLGIDRLDLIARPRRRRVGINPTDLQSIRERRVREMDGEDAEMPRGPIDSGLGVRIQGGRVYDSKYGVTCHWCRQKTLEEHVTCTHPSCGEGRRLAVSFCKLCLKNRQGEDILQAEASGKWECPRCRGSCGEGCITCCNCGPCRKAAGQAPTHQIIQLARAAGFDNVHDFLVHQKTGEEPEEIAARKRQSAWGAWLDIPFDADTAAAAIAAREEAEQGVAAGEPATVQVAPRRRRSSAAAAAKVAADSATAAAKAAKELPRGAGAAVLLYRALRWHLLSAAFCAAVKEFAPPAPKRGRPAKAAAAAPKQPDAAAKRSASKAAPAAATAPRRSGRGSQGAAEAPAQLPAKIDAFFKPAAAASKKQEAPAGQKAVAATAAAAATRGRISMRARK